MIGLFYRFFNNLYHKYLNKMRWRAANPNNDTTNGNNFDNSIVRVGNYSYGAINVLACSKKYELNIGHFVSIGPNVMFVLENDHYTNHISTFPFKVKCLGIDTTEAISKGNIIVDDDVWIGYGATIMSSVHIGQGAIIAAGAVVTKDVPPYAIVGGVPAKVIKYRFEKEMREELLKIDYSKLTKEDVEKHIDELYVDLMGKQQLFWVPVKGENCNESNAK